MSDLTTTASVQDAPKAKESAGKNVFVNKVAFTVSELALRSACCCLTSVKDLLSNLVVTVKLILEAYQHLTCLLSMAR